MKYVILIYSTPPPRARSPAKSRIGPSRSTNDLIDELTDSGEFLNIYRMSDASNTRTVHLVSGAAVVTDGPFGESRELLTLPISPPGLRFLLRRQCRPDHHHHPVFHEQS